MSRAYTPRRCSARWLDGDCPAEVLAIIDDKREPLERFTVFYTHVETDHAGRDWLTYLSLNESGAMYHGEIEAYKVAAYRYRESRRYAKWSTLPDAVKRAVRHDLATTRDDQGREVPR